MAPLLRRCLAFFGSQRVMQTVTGSGQRGLGLLDELLGAVGDFAGNRPHVDDLTLLAVELDTPSQ